MNRKIMMKILELLEETYPNPCTADILMREIELRDIDGEFFQIIKYLKDTHKIIIVLVPENRMGLPTGREKLQKIDEITINPDGINFLDEMKRLETDKNRNFLLLDTAIVLTQIAIIGIVLTILEKFDISLSKPSINVPWLLSLIIWFVFLAFVYLLVLKIINLIFSKESWKGLLFNRD